MFATGVVEDMLRVHPAPYASIQLFKEIDSDRWSATVSHYDPARVERGSSIEVFDDDPVVALGKALTEDERRIRSTERKYAAAPKLGVTPTQIELEEAIAVVVADSMMDLIG